MTAILKDVIYRCIKASLVVWVSILIMDFMFLKFISNGLPEHMPLLLAVSICLFVFTSSNWISFWRLNAKSIKVFWQGIVTITSISIVINMLIYQFICLTYYANFHIGSDTLLNTQELITYTITLLLLILNSIIGPIQFKTEQANALIVKTLVYWALLVLWFISIAYIYVKSHTAGADLVMASLFLFFIYLNPIMQKSIQLDTRKKLSLYGMLFILVHLGVSTLLEYKGLMSPISLLDSLTKN